MSLLSTFPKLGTTNADAKFVGVKQYFEIQVDSENSTIYTPLYVRRRITLVTLQQEADYQTCIPQDGTPDSDAKAWLLGAVSVDVDYVLSLSFSTPAGLVVFTAPDDDGQSSPLSGKWFIESKDLQSSGDGSTTILVTWKNEGAWVEDSSR